MRAPGFDYRDPGPYFVTICASHGIHRFGAVLNGEMHLNEAGKMVQSAWRRLPVVFPGLVLDAFVVMPNHLHGLVTLDVPDAEMLTGRPTLTDVVRWFKTETTNRYIRGVKRLEWEPFAGHLWQPGFHDRIVRSEAHMARARGYIEGNPGAWETDEYHTRSGHP
jgi:REP element-mobilizing transposase RayT